MGDLCKIYPNEKEEEYVIAEVVGFQDSRLILMPVDSVEGVGTGCVVENTGHPPVGSGWRRTAWAYAGWNRTHDGWNGRNSRFVLSAGKYAAGSDGSPDYQRGTAACVKAVDGLITVGKGQRIGVFAGSGVGKSTLLGMFAKKYEGRYQCNRTDRRARQEAREFIERDLYPEGMALSVVVVATSDKPALIRNKCAKTATAVAEYFRDQGKDVLLMMDSMTRFSQAQREIGLASGEPPVTRGYPPSVYAQMPKLLNVPV